MTAAPTDAEHDLDDQLLWLLLDQPPGVTVRLASTASGAVLHDPTGNRIAEVSANWLPLGVDPWGHEAAMAEARAELKIDGEWISDNPYGYQLNDPDRTFHWLTIVKFRPAGDLR
jgi:hypothetical protein